MLKVISAVKYANRDMFAIFDTELNKIVFMYQSTGHNSGKPGVLFPFAGTWVFPSFDDGDNNNIVDAEKYFNTERLPMGWIVKVALIFDIKNKKSLISFYNEDRFDFPEYGEWIKSISDELSFKDKKPDIDYRSIEINSKGVNEWIRSIWEDIKK